MNCFFKKILFVTMNILQKIIVLLFALSAACMAFAQRETNNWIYLSKPELRLYVVTPDDSVLYTCRIACGAVKGHKQAKGDFRTPEGRFFINGIYDATNWMHKTRDGRMVKGCYGPLFFSVNTYPWSGIGIHGTNQPNSIGTRASEGCIRVHSDNVVVLRKYVFEKMRVLVSAEDAKTPPFKR